MTALLETAVAQTNALPEDMQDYLAKVMLDALDELRWDRQFESSQDVLAMLADEGNSDYEAGHTKRMKKMQEP